MIFIPMAVCIVRVAVVGLSEAFKLTVFPLLLVPGGGTDSCSEMRRGAAGWSPDTTDSYFPPDAQDRENRELAITRLLSLYIYCNPGQLRSAVLHSEGCLRAKLEVMKATHS